MGRYMVSFQVVGSVSRSNSPQDAADDKLWQDLHDRVQAITKEDKYTSIDPDVV